jgi:hypothetical protein
MKSKDLLVALFALGVVVLSWPFLTVVNTPVALLGIPLLVLYVTLESLAARLRVAVVARHTARGDALVAGALMLGLLPELARRGRRTLADALWFQRSVLL